MLAECWCGQCNEDFDGRGGPTGVAYAKSAAHDFAGVTAAEKGTIRLLALANRQEITYALLTFTDRVSVGGSRFPGWPRSMV